MRTDRHEPTTAGASDGAPPAKGQGAVGECRDTTSGDDQLVCDALRLALVATRLRVAWHAGAIGADKAMEVLDQSICKIRPPRTAEQLYNFYDRGIHGGLGGSGIRRELADLAGQDGHETGHLLDAPPPRLVVRSNLSRAREEAMTTTEDQGSDTSEATTVDMKLEVVTIPVSDVDRAKEFYRRLGWRIDADIKAGDAFRVVQVTPHHSSCSIAFGKGLTKADPGSIQRLLLAVHDIDAAREDLISRGVDVSEVFHLAGGRVSGPDPEGRSYQTYASFSDPDGNEWQLQEIKTRLPGREWED